MMYSFAFERFLFLNLRIKNMVELFAFKTQKFLDGLINPMSVMIDLVLFEGSNSNKIAPFYRA